MKKIISILLVAVMVFTGYVSDFNVKAEETEEIVTSGTCGDDIRWEFNEETGILSLDGTGEMDDFKGDSEIPWSNFKYQIKDIKISKGITSIGTFAFRDIIYVDNLILPDGIEKIGNYAFCWSHFKNIQFPNTLAYIGNGAFECCMDLEVVDLFSTQVREIKKECFYNCRKLKLFVSPYELNKIEDFAFGCCQDLKYMDLNEQLTSIGEGSLS